MPINIFSNTPIAVTAIQTIDFVSLGLDSSKILVIHRIGQIPASWMPTRGINSINSFIKGQGYNIYAKQDLDLSNFVAPPIESDYNAIKNWVIANYAQLSHTHSMSQIVGLIGALGEKLTTPANPMNGQVVKYINGQIVWSDDITATGGTGGSIAWADITGKPTAFTPTAHTHEISEVNGLQSALNGKAALTHNHAASDITSGIFAPARMGSGTPSSSTYLRGDGTWATIQVGSNYTAGAGISIVNNVVSNTITNNNQLTNGAGYITASDLGGYLTVSTAAATYQPLDADLTSIAGLSGTTGFLKKTAANTWTLDTSTYLTSSSLTWNNIADKPTTFNPSAHNHAAGDITSGVIATARLGTGTASATTALFGDGSWKTISSSTPTLQQVLTAGNNSTLSMLVSSLSATGAIFAENCLMLGDAGQGGLVSGPTYISSSDTNLIIQTSHGYDVRFVFENISTSSDYIFQDASGTIAFTHQIPTNNTQLTNGAGYITSSALTWNNITGKPTTFTPSAHNHSATEITSGTLSTARMGTGTADATKVLFGDGQWKALPSATIPTWDQVLQAGNTTMLSPQIKNSLGMSVLHLYTDDDGGAIDLINSSGITTVTMYGASGNVMANEFHVRDFVNSGFTRIKGVDGGFEAIAAWGDTFFLAQPDSIYFKNNFSASITNNLLTADHTYQLPNVSGTLALASQIPTNNNQLTNGAAYITTASLTWSNISGKPTTFTATPHSHIITDIANLQNTLDAKAWLGHVHSASDINSGIINTARLGTGTANAGTILYGDGTWKAAPTGNATVGNLQQVTTTGNTTSDDIEITDANKGIIIRNANGQRVRITLNNDLSILTTLL